MASSAGKQRSSIERQTTKNKFRNAEKHEQKNLPVLGSSAEACFLRELQELESFFGMDDEQMNQSVHEMFQKQLPTKDALDSARPSLEMGKVSNKATELAVDSLASTASSTMGRKMHGDAQAGHPTDAFASSGTSVSMPSVSSSAHNRSSSSWHRASHARSFSLSVAKEALATISNVGAQAVDDKAAQKRMHRPVTPSELVEASKPRPISVPPIFPKMSDRPRESHYSYFTRKIPGERPDHRRVMWGRAAGTRKVYHFNEIMGTT
mmetsp:Transcript_73131/g.192906  ORF Transcript_73131/g.192906 Transcript_73131/m.192906 type:complete len:265 (+) Transcript_73131:3-797(+)